MIMIEIQYSDTALLLLVNQKNGTAHPQLHQLLSEKEMLFLPAMFNPLYSSTNQQLFKRISATK